MSDLQRMRTRAFAEVKRSVDEFIVEAGRGSLFLKFNYTRRGKAVAREVRVDYEGVSYRAPGKGKWKHMSLPS
ncbi:MAG: hypothetical protein MHM6MM_007089, partial [Cercozoa sp. M6MM]